MTNLKIPCPACGEMFDLEQALDSADGKRFVDLLTSMPPTVVRPLYSYLKMFKPKKQVLSWARALKLLQELEQPIKDARINRNGALYMIPLEHWVLVLTDLVRNRPATLVLPLKTHAYLLSILASQADKQAANHEKKIEQGRQNRSAVAPKQGPTYAELVALAAQKERQRKIPPGMALDTESGELVKKPVSKPPSDWNPLKALLPVLPEKTLANRAEIEAAEKLLTEQQPENQK